ncbi:MAG: S41 family peptidase [Hungatella sp.]|nr:S41 family peptidase [Hungatella sp.]
MESKNKFWKGVLVGALVMAFAGLMIVGVSAGIFLIGKTVMDQPDQIVQESDPQPPGEGELELDRITEKMNYIQEIVKEYYLFDEDVELVEDGIYMGLMYGLNDPYSVYYNEEDYQSLMEDTSGEYCGIGAMVSQNRTTGISTVVKVFETAPAFEAGMLPGDIIYKVDDEDVAGMELDLLVTNYIRGEEGSRVKVTVLRGDANEEVDLDIERRKVEVPTVEHEMMADNIGYIYVMQFDGVTGPQFQAAVDDLEKQGMEKLIIDLRDNPGGLLDAVVEMLAYVLPEDKMDGMLVYTADKDGKGDRFFCDDGKIQYESDYGQQASGFPKKDGHEIDVPMAVLVNGNSASASEVFTGAIMDYEVGIVVGTQTFGKGIVQSLLPLGDGTAIKLTTAHYYTPSGFDLHGVGLKPDIEVELDEELRTKAVVEKDEDNQIQAAIEALK